MDTPLKNYISELTYQSGGLSIAEFLSLLANKFPDQVHQWVVYMEFLMNHHVVLE